MPSRETILEQANLVSRKQFVDFCIDTLLSERLERLPNRAGDRAEASDVIDARTTRGRVGRHSL